MRLFLTSYMYLHSTNTNAKLRHSSAFLFLSSIKGFKAETTLFRWLSCSEYDAAAVVNWLSLESLTRATEMIINKSAMFWHQIINTTNYFAHALFVHVTWLLFSVRCICNVLWCHCQINNKVHYHFFLFIKSNKIFTNWLLLKWYRICI